MTDAPDSNDPVVQGTPVPPGELKRFEELRAFLSPIGGLERVLEHAKWVFTTVTVVGTLGAGLSSGILGDLSRSGRYLFGGAVLLVGLSLAAAALALTPKWEEFYEDNPGSLKVAIESSLKRRRWWILTSSFLFAAALILAGAAPFVSVLQTEGTDAVAHAVLSYTLEPGRTLSAELTGSRLPPYAVGELTLTSVAEPNTPIAIARSAADSSGLLSVKFEDLVLGDDSHALRADWFESGADAPAWSDEVSINPGS